MLLSVFKSCRSVTTVLRNFRLNSYLCSTRVVTKKKDKVLFFDMLEAFKEKTPEQIESLKIVPEGYKLIYLNKDLKLVVVARIAVFGLIAIGTWIAYGTWINPDSVVLREGFFTKEQALFMVVMQAAILYLFASRHVYYIFRNEKSYRTVYYGLLGKLQPRIVDHEAKELVSPKRGSIFPFFHYLKGKPVIISVSYFFNKLEYAMLTKLYEEDG